MKMCFFVCPYFHSEKFYLSAFINNLVIPISFSKTSTFSKPNDLQGFTINVFIVNI